VRLFSLRFLSAGRVVSLVDLPLRELIRAGVPGFFADELKDFWLRRRKAHIVFNTEQNRRRRSRVLDDQRPVFFFHSEQHFAETGADAEDQKRAIIFNAG
jgi:hypothetical protein